MDEYIQLALQHWPFLVVAAALWVFGHFAETALFTHARAYGPGRFQGFWRFARESMEIHPLLAGALIGVLWDDPVGQQWKKIAEVAYFMGAGVVSLFGYTMLDLIAERMGVKRPFYFPGERERQDAASVEHAGANTIPEPPNSAEKP